MLIPLSPFAHHDCEWVYRDELESGLPLDWIGVCLLGSAQQAKRRLEIEEIIGVILSPKSTIIETEGRGDWPIVLSYHAYGPTRVDPIHVKFGDHQFFPVGKIMHACQGLCDQSQPPSAP